MNRLLLVVASIGTDAGRVISELVRADMRFVCVPLLVARQLKDDEGNKTSLSDSAMDAIQGDDGFLTASYPDGTRCALSRADLEKVGGGQGFPVAEWPMGRALEIEAKLLDGVLVIALGSNDGRDPLATALKVRNRYLRSMGLASC